MDYPADWEVKKLGEIVDIIRGSSPRPIESFLTFIPDGVNWIKISDADKNEKYITKTEEKITHEGALRSVFVNEGDLILSNSMSFGRPYILKISGCIHDGWLKLYNYKSYINKEFLCYSLSSKNTYKQYLTFAAGSGVQNLNKNVVKNVLIPLPPLAEQKAIAETLETFDAHIKNLSELIEKKKAIRDGALEDLMSGRIRLKNFSGDWEIKKLGEITSLITKGTTPLDKSGLGTINFIKVENINDRSGEISNLTKISLQEHNGYLKRSQLRENDILFSIAGTLGRVTLIEKKLLPANTNQALAIIRLKYNNHQFIKFFLNSNYIKKFIAENPTIGAQPNLALKQISDIKIFLPPLAEQKAIAETLTAFDDEIKALEAERDKIKKIRDGAMNDLLTGKVRLKNYGK